MNLEVARRWFSPVSTCGLMSIDGIFLCYTIERQLFKDGMQKPYAIPAGGPYPIILDQSFRFNETNPTWYIKVGRKVPHIGGIENFTGLEIHPANWPSDLLGCIGVGTDHYENYIDPHTKIPGGCVLGSDQAFFKLMDKLLNQQDISLTIVEATQ